MAFHFRFNSLLKQRRQRLEAAQAELAAARHAQQQLLIREEQALCRMAEQQTLWETDQARGVDVATLLCMKEYRIALERQLQSLRTELLQAARTVEEKKAAFIECEKAVKMLECLEEAERLSYRYLQRQREQKELDEISILKGFHEND